MLSPLPRIAASLSAQSASSQIRRSPLRRGRPQRHHLAAPPGVERIAERVSQFSVAGRGGGDQLKRAAYHSSGMTLGRITRRGLERADCDGGNEASQHRAEQTDQDGQEPRQRLMRHQVAVADSEPRDKVKYTPSPSDQRSIQAIRNPSPSCHARMPNKTGHTTSR
jgi:hypothetical protein